MEKRVLTHIGDVVKEKHRRIFVCECCAERSVLIHGEICRECADRAERFNFKRLAVRCGRIGWIVIAVITIHFVMTKIVR